MIALIYFLIVILIMNFFVGQYQRALDHSRLYSRRLQKEIAEHKRARTKVKSSLREKDILLKEVHHRVKNNLQVISSLINLQSQTVSDLELKKRMTELRNRIRSMGLVHNQLYRSNDFSEIDFLEYAKDLIDNLIISHNNPSIKVNLDVNSFRFDLNTAVPLGLIINELVTNSFKHAFPKGGKGYIQVNLEKNGEYFILTIKDNGTGFQPDEVMNRSTSMGLDLIKTLIRQIRGRLDVKSDPAQGTVSQVIFPGSASI
jgi:two-component sensor histidine kinase